MQADGAWRLVACCGLLLAGCGRCCDSSETTPSRSGEFGTAPVSTAVTEPNADFSCCEVPTTRTALLAGSRDTQEVSLQSVKLDQLTAAIKAQKGKVVILDIWSVYCIPCKKEFPRLVKLHEKHAKDGLVCMSLCVDNQEDKPAALKFLKARQATFTNYFFEEGAKVWQEHFKIGGVPGVFIWDRAGNQAARYDLDDPEREFAYDQVEKKVAELLQQKK
jgi:thiol-disulfide isomerase/thioredoxin